MRLKESFEEKRDWRNIQKRAGNLPKDYLIVYKEIQKYLMKVGPTHLSKNFQPLYEILDLFEDGVIHKKDVLEVTGEDIAVFADSFIPDSNTFSDV